MGIYLNDLSKSNHYKTRDIDIEKHWNRLVKIIIPCDNKALIKKT